MKLLTIQEVAELLEFSIPTIRRYIAKARRGKSRFPLPFTPAKAQARWRLEDIENWNENLPVELQSGKGVSSMEDHRAIAPEGTHREIGSCNWLKNKQK